MRHFSITTFLVVSLSLFLTACQTLEDAPIEQMQRTQLVSTLAPSETKMTETVSQVKNQAVVQFICKDGKTVKIQQVKAKKRDNAKNQRAILVSFSNRSHTLSPAVSKTGKRYSNIRWNWEEDFNGKATLTDNRQKILARECVKKTS